MLEKRASSLEEQVSTWIAAFDTAIAKNDVAALADLFQTDSYWRNLSGISWPIRTFSSKDTIARELCRRAAAFDASDFTIDFEILPPRENVIAEREVIEAIFRFGTKHGPGEGVVRLIPASAPGAMPKAWTLSTSLDMDRICRAWARSDDPESHARNFSEPGWLDQRKTDTAFGDREPEVLVIGGGHAGLSAAAELQRLGHDVLVIDREKRIGDNWRLRYNGLKLHNKTPVNHLRYLPFPVTAPAYMPKDKLANWLESYVDAMDINFWTETSFEQASYDEKTCTWTVEVQRADGRRRSLRPKHIVMATSVSGIPNIPEIPTIENFKGPVVHSSAFTAGAEWEGRSAIVFGTGTSAHDVAQELHAHGAKVAIVQRSPTLVVNVDPSAQLYDQIYLDDGPPLEVRDLLNSSIPYPVVRAVHKVITRRVKELDKPMLDRLEKAGFRLEFGEDETGWPLKFRTRGGGYYFNVGCSDLIADGKIALIQASDIKRFTADGLELEDGSVRKADLVVLGTGFKGLNEAVAARFGADVAERVGVIWGLDPEYHELRNMWTKTGQPGLWFTGGAFSMCRIYSRIMALQIDAIEHGRLEK